MSLNNCKHIARFLGWWFGFVFFFCIWTTTCSFIHIIKKKKKKNKSLPPCFAPMPVCSFVIFTLKTIMQRRQNEKNLMLTLLICNYVRVDVAQDDCFTSKVNARFLSYPIFLYKIFIPTNIFLKVLLLKKNRTWIICIFR